MSILTPPPPPPPIFGKRAAHDFLENILWPHGSRFRDCRKQFTVRSALYLSICVFRCTKHYRRFFLPSPEQHLIPSVGLRLGSLEGRATSPSGHGGFGGSSKAPPMCACIGHNGAWLQPLQAARLAGRALLWHGSNPRR